MTGDRFKTLGQPTEKRIRGLPQWSQEWIATLKDELIYWEALKRGQRHRRRVNSPPPEAGQIFFLPEWAQDWIDTLQAEVNVARGKQ